MKDAGDGIDQRSLAGAIRTDDSQNFAAFKIERYAS
jgi:hypothetical protein